MYLGLDAHILTFPVKQGRLINVVAFTSDRSRPDPAWPSDSPWVRNASQEEMLAAFTDWGDAARVLLECIPSHLGEIITSELHVPVIGIGAGPHTDGQILVLYDILDITTALTAVETLLVEDGADIERGVAAARAIEAYHDAARV